MRQELRFNEVRELHRAEPFYNNVIRSSLIDVTQMGSRVPDRRNLMKFYGFRQGLLCNVWNSLKTISASIQETRQNITAIAVT